MGKPSDLTLVKENIILTFVKMVRKTLFQTVETSDVKTIAIRKTDKDPILNTVSIVSIYSQGTSLRHMRVCALKVTKGSYKE